MGVIKPVTVDLIAAARPNFMKIGPLYHALAREPWCRVRLVHTGQHYDANMSHAFFQDFRLPEPDIHLGVGSGTHAEQTGGVMIAYERECLRERPDWIIVVGDVNSTAACALVGGKLCIPVAHLEAGLRSGDRRMPEEINRIVTDALADVLWTPSADADENLRREGVPEDKIERVGNIMIDAFEMQRERIEADGTRASLGLEAGAYAVVTLHRPSNVDDEATLTTLVEQLVSVAGRLPLVFAVHPRTRAKLQAFDLLRRLEVQAAIRLIEPLGYVQFMNLVIGARALITDSGGVQEETSYLGIPCLTLRENTERPVTLTQGSNRLVRPGDLRAAVEAVMEAEQARSGARSGIELWDGQTAKRVVDSLRRRLESLAVG
ncbi:MAG TPA: UDP-N-acetylglucosamine 2-epimerase (non-hydrolyzing) [Gammaproteobacteria bacterium]|nr:UDP-N-acetylglucosamine 2-epimerase (non-hydrolyzing) [Gammaproteobacteria bacterium]